MPTKIVYANGPYIYAYAWHSFDQKVAKIPAETALVVKNVIEGWYEIEKLPATGGIYQPADRWFVDPAVTHEAALPPVEPPPSSGPVVVGDVAQALAVIVKAIKAAWG